MANKQLTHGWIIIAAASIISVAVADQGPVDWYDCSGKIDGNYVHPTDCTKFMTCVAGRYAYERDCSAGLNYDPVNDRCEWPSIVGCITDPPTTTAAPTTPTTTTTTTTAPTTTTTQTTTTPTTTTTQTTTTPTTTTTQTPTTPTTTTPTTTTPTTTTPTTTTPTTTTPTTTTPTTTTPTTTTPTTTTPTTTTPTTTTTTTTTQTPPTSEGTTPQPIFNCSGLADGNYPHPTNCSKFVSCVAEEYLYERDCPDGLHYDPKTDQCDFPEIARCDPNAVPTSTTTEQSSESTTTEEPSTTFQASSTTEETTTSEPGLSSTIVPEPAFNCSGLADGNYPHPTNCSMYVSCVGGQYPYEMACPAGLHYDPRFDKCDYPENVECQAGGSTTTEDPSTETTTEDAPTTTEEPTTSVITTTTEVVTSAATTEQSETTTESSTTEDPSTTEQEQTETTQVSTEPTTEDPSSTSNPTTQDTTTSTEVSTTQETSTTPQPPVNSTTTDPDACDHDCEYVAIDCHNYYTCINFQRKEYHQCSEEAGLAFNPTIKVCDRIENVEGCRPNTTEPPSTTPPEECGCEYKPHETDCSKYYFCSDGCRRSTCEVRTCPGDLLWSVDFYGDGSEHQQCSVPESATCAAQGSGAALLEFTCIKRNDGLYRNEHNCHSFWKCSNGTALLYACPKGFIYNPEVKSCDFPAKSLKFCTNDEY